MIPISTGIRCVRWTSRLRPCQCPYPHALRRSGHPSFLIVPFDASVLFLVPDRWTRSCRPSDFTLSLFVSSSCSLWSLLFLDFSIELFPLTRCGSQVFSSSRFVAFFPLPSCISIQPLLGSFIAPLSTSIAQDRTFQYMFLISRVGGFGGHR